jgi:regulation of enolase protein 1 (concanavalin A-like superfamily)
MRHGRVNVVVVCAIVGAINMFALPVGVSAQEALPSPWVGADIGTPSPAGMASFDGQSFTMSAGGVDIWDTSDQFHFVYQPISGDVDIVARIDSLAAADQWSKIGVMIRADLTDSSAHAFAMLSGANGLLFQQRPQPGSSSMATGGDMAAAPVWVRLTRAGTTVTGYSSPDGGSWQQIDSATIALGQTAYVGLAITSHNPGSAAQAVVSQTTVTPASTTLSVPAGQQDADIGSPAIAGSATFAQGVYTISAAGTDIWNTSDQFHYVYQPVSGDVDIVAHVKSLQVANPWSKAGVMVRESLDPDARHAMALMSAANGYAFEWRLDIGGFSSSIHAGAGRAPAWVRLVRTGSSFQAFKSTDGVSWRSMGVETVPMTDPVYVGLAVTSHTASSSTTAVFDKVTITQPGAPPNQPPVVTLTSPATATQYTAPATIPVAATASDPQNQLTRVDFLANATRIGSLTAPPFAMTWSSVPSGTYSLTAVAYDAAGLSATSAAATIMITGAPLQPPRFAVFQASPDNDTLVNSYRLDIFSNGADPATATPVATSDLGKPAPDASGTITVDCGTFLAALAPATYVATVSAVGAGGIGQSAPATFVR